MQQVTNLNASNEKKNYERRPSKFPTVATIVSLWFICGITKSSFPVCCVLEARTFLPKTVTVTRNLNWLLQ